MKSLYAALVLLVLAVLCAARAFAASGLSPWSLGPSSGTALVVISASPTSYWGVSASSASVGDSFKCWNSSSTSGLSFGSDVTLGGQQILTTDFSRASEPANQPVAASRGVVCGKDGAGSQALVYTSF